MWVQVPFLLITKKESENISNGRLFVLGAEGYGFNSHFSDTILKLVITIRWTMC